MTPVVLVKLLQPEIYFSGNPLTSDTLKQDEIHIPTYYEHILNFLIGCRSEITSSVFQWRRQNDNWGGRIFIYVRSA